MDLASISRLSVSMVLLAFEI